MKKYIWTIVAAVGLLSHSMLQGQEIESFNLEGAAGFVTVTQDIPAYFFGNYESISPNLQSGKLLFKAGRNPASHHWWDKDSTGKNFTWGVLVKNGKIVKQRITPPNSAYKPYDRLKLIIRYEDDTLGLVAWGLYRAESVKYGTRIVAGRYVKR